MIRLANIALLALFVSAGLRAQSAPASRPPSAPAEGFVSPTKYTNASFGFALPIPQDKSLHSISLPSRDPSKPFLFGLGSNESGVSAFIVTAVQTGNASSAEARKVASGPKGQSAKRIEIGSTEFWRSESQEKTPAGRMRIVNYATALPGYILNFRIVSFDDKFTDELVHAIESVTFFDPAKARELAGSDSQPYNPATEPSQGTGARAPHPSGRIEDLSPGIVSGNNYTNGALGLSYQFPAGWSLADKATQDKVTETGHEAAWGNSPRAAREHEMAQKCTKVLLWTSKYPEGTHTGDVNPLIVLLAADPDCFPSTKFPASSDDEETIRQLGQVLVRSFGDTIFGEQESMKLGTLGAQGHLFIAVSGVSRQSFLGRAAPIEIHNSMVLTPANDFWLIWIFSSGSEAGLQELRNTNITFSNVQAGP
jgi:hypothetical protein